MPGLNLEPFPRQVLIGLTAGVVSYYSESYDLKDYRTVAYTMTTYASMPNSTSPPALMFLDASNDPQGPWDELIPAGTGPAVGGTVNGTETVTGRYLRVRVDVLNGETTAFQVRLVARSD